MAKRPQQAPEPLQNSPAEQIKTKLSLQDAFHLTIRRSEEFAIQKLNVEETWADFLDASGTAIGDMSFQLLHERQDEQLGTRSDTSGATSTATRPSRRTRRFVLSQPLFQGFKTVAALTGAGHLRAQRQADLKRAEQLIFLDVALSYFNILRIQKDIEITHEILALFKNRVAELEEWEKIGKSRPGEVATARSRMKRIEADMASRKGQLAVNQRIFEFLIGAPIEMYELEPVTLKEYVSVPFSEILGFAALRPDVLSAEETKDIARSGIVDAQSGLWPEISLDGNIYEKREGFQDTIDWDLLFTINVPLYRGGETLGELKRAVTEYKKSKLTADRAQRLAESEIKRTHDAWRSSYEETQAMAEAVQAAEENYRLQKEDYDKRLVDNLDVLDALETLNDDRLDANFSYFETAFHYWQFEIAKGHCCESV